MKIREINKFELEDLLKLYEHLHETDDPLPTEEQIQITWREIQETPRLKYFGVYIDDKLVSSCNLSIIPNLTRGCRPFGLIENVVTHIDFRRKGLGQRLLEHTLTFAWDQGCYKVMLLTGRKDEGVYKFYESVGFDRNAKQAFISKPNN